jgi:hypothetical protein
MRMVATALPLITSVVTLLAIGCGSGHGGGNGNADSGAESLIVSKESLQADIADRLVKAGQPPGSVTCLQDLVGEVGRTARCDVVMGETNSFQPVATVTGVEGTIVDYELAPALSQAQLERAVARLVVENGGPPVDSVDCEAGLDGAVKAVAYCDVETGGVRARRAVQVTEVSGLTMNFTLRTD